MDDLLHKYKVISNNEHRLTLEQLHFIRKVPVDDIDRGGLDNGSIHFINIIYEEVFSNG